VRAIDPTRLRKALRQLKAGVRARSFEAADARLDRFAESATRSTEHMDAAVRAIQTLRDLEIIDRGEAAYLFSSLFGRALDEQRERNPAFDRAIDTGVELELLWAAMHDERLAKELAYHRAYGEDELARMLKEQPDEYGLLAAHGQHSLLEDKPTLKELKDPKPGLPVSAALPERALAMLAAETTREWHPAWLALCEELRGADPAAAVAAIQSLREVGSISFEESLVLIDMAIEPIVDAKLERDREFHRLDRALEAAQVKYGIDYKEPEASRPLEFRVIEFLRLRRADNITAVVLRQFGEHRMANLMTTDPEKFNEMRQDLSFGRHR
jgi:hypothetical protein